jgi:uncharacterized protein YndB with AHSA1/START domain
VGKVSAAIRLDAPAATVWRVATRIADLPRWLPEVASAQLLDADLATGSRVRLLMTPAVGNAEIVGTVKQLHPPTHLGIGGSAGPLSVDVRTRLEPDGQAATRVVLEIAVGAPPLLGFIAREAERRINGELPASLERFRALVAAEPDAA